MTRWIVWTVLGAGACNWEDTPFPEPPSAAGPEADVRRSNIEIPSGQVFELGGGHRGQIDVRIENVGRDDVEVITEVGQALRLGPGAVTETHYGPGQMARLRNASAEAARLKVVYIQSEPEELSMRYSEIPSTP